MCHPVRAKAARMTEQPVDSYISQLEVTNPGTWDRATDVMHADWSPAIYAVKQNAVCDLAVLASDVAFNSGCVVQPASRSDAGHIASEWTVLL